MPIITLTTDFGQQDWFVGTMKGVILDRAPRATIVDLTHGVPPGDLRSAAFSLTCSCRYFPVGTIHVVVVDPGVGSGRTALAVETERYVFLGPDNGVLQWALAGERVRSMRRLENATLFRQPISATFHGRDVFGPVAGYLARGGRLDHVGPEVTTFLRLPWPEPRQRGRGWVGEVIYVDRFGNAITNVPNGPLPTGSDGKPDGLITFGRHGRCRLGSCYQDAPRGTAVGVAGSTGFLEIAVNGGSAARQLRLRVGSQITLS